MTFLGMQKREITCLWNQAPAEKRFFQDSVFRIGYPNSTGLSIFVATASLTSSDVSVKFWGMLQDIFHDEGRGWDRECLNWGTSPVLLIHYILAV